MRPPKIRTQSWLLRRRAKTIAMQALSAKDDATRSDVLYIKHHQWHHYAEQLQHFCFYSSVFNLIFFLSAFISIRLRMSERGIQVNHAISSDLREKRASKT